MPAGGATITSINMAGGGGGGGGGFDSVFGVSGGYEGGYGGYGGTSYIVINGAGYYAASGGGPGTPGYSAMVEYGTAGGNGTVVNTAVNQSLPAGATLAIYPGGGGGGGSGPEHPPFNNQHCDAGGGHFNAVGVVMVGGIGPRHIRGTRVNYYNWGGSGATWASGAAVAATASYDSSSPAGHTVLGAGYGGNGGSWGQGGAYGNFSAYPGSQSYGGAGTAAGGAGGSGDYWWSCTDNYSGWPGSGNGGGGGYIQFNYTISGGSCQFQ